jgi:GrpB-like predicted nucleotidyltransferase (UPF0157 family)
MILVAHDRNWAAEFAQLGTLYSEVIGDLALRIEHIGSTAVPDLLAKPILDIDIVMQDYSVFPQLAMALGYLGYEHNGDQGIYQREVFKPKGVVAPISVSTTEWMPHHLYVCPVDGIELQRHIRFRDLLRTRVDLRQEYEAMKIRIAQRAGDDRRIYAEIKERECKVFIERALEQT